MSCVAKKLTQNLVGLQGELPVAAKKMDSFKEAGGIVLWAQYKTGTYVNVNIKNRLHQLEIGG